jgi:hypothetical protein
MTTGVKVERGSTFAFCQIHADQFARPEFALYENYRYRVCRGVSMTPYCPSNICSARGKPIQMFVLKLQFVTHHIL